MKRRDFLADVARLAALSAIVPNDWRVVFRPRWADDPFQLGVASGDPTTTSAVIWTRLAPRPLEPEGGMAGPRTGVNWEVADDEQFTRIVKRGRATAVPELAYSASHRRGRARARPLVLLSVHVDGRGEPRRPVAHRA